MVIQEWKTWLYHYVYNSEINKNHNLYTIFRTGDQWYKYGNVKKLILQYSVVIFKTFPSKLHGYAYNQYCITV